MAKVTPRLISLTIDSTEVSDQASKVTISSAESDSDFVTFKDARSGGSRDYTLNMTIAQDHASGTLWSLMFDNAGTNVDGIYAPYGNETASASQPHYKFTAVVSEPDGDYFGAEADKSTTAVATCDVAWKLTGKPTKDDGTGA